MAKIWIGEQAVLPGAIILATTNDYGLTLRLDGGMVRMPVIFKKQGEANIAIYEVFTDVPEGDLCEQYVRSRMTVRHLAPPTAAVEIMGGNVARIAWRIFVSTGP